MGERKCPCCKGTGYIFDEPVMNEEDIKVIKKALGIN